MMETKRITRMGMLTSLSLLLSYVETLLPSFFTVPGIKLGLANSAVVFALYTLPLRDVLFISLLRVFISGMLFGNVLSLLYSLSGAVLSFLVMALMKKMKLSITAVSISGAVVHNMAQLLVAFSLVRSRALRYYLPFLILSGALTGFAIGRVSSHLLSHLEGDSSLFTFSPLSSSRSEEAFEKHHCKFEINE